MITTSDTFVLEADSQIQYKTASIQVEPTYVPSSETLYLKLRLYDSVSGAALGWQDITLSKTDVDSETGSGSGDLATWYNAVEQAVITWITAIPDNSSASFAIV